MNSRIQSFAPIYDRQARVLILGSMPGVTSLALTQYYGHPRNAFWAIMGEIAGAEPGLAYDQRLHRLRACGIALWDVLQSCQRVGSLDSSIHAETAEPNDIAALLETCPGVQLVCFNGAAAERLYGKHILPRLTGLPRTIIYQRLPSTSPAHAAMSFDAKCNAWREALQEHMVLPQESR